MSENFFDPKKIVELEHYAESKNVRIQRRARLLLSYATGKPTRVAAAEAGLSRGRARYWKRQFQLKGLAVFPTPTSHPIVNIDPANPVPSVASASTMSIEAEPFYPLEIPSLLSPGIEVVQEPIPETLPFPQLFKQPGLLSTDSMAEAGRKTILFHFAEMLSHEPETRLGENIEALHDMRVATRRLRAAFKIFGDAFRPKIIKPLLKGLRGTGRCLGRVRDLDVLIERARSYQASLPASDQPGLNPILDTWMKDREVGRFDMFRHFDSPEYLDFKNRLNYFSQSPGVGVRQLSLVIPTPSLVRDVAPVLIYTRLVNVRSFEPILGNASLEQLHALRIEFKQLRYAVEFFREVLSPEAKNNINTLKGIQDHLGNLNDTRITCQLITAFLENWEALQSRLPMGERQNPEPIVSYLAAMHAERHHLMVTFQDTWKSFDSPEFRQSIALAIAAL